MLPTTVWYPSAARPGQRFPLVVFAHGFDARPAMYARLLRAVAAAGFVVAAPLFPISGAGLPGSPREDDVPNQALDLRAVIDTMTATGGASRWPASLVDPTRIAVSGHSDGAETAAASVLIRADQDPRIDAAVLLAGQVPNWGAIQPSAVPTLVVQGDADTINPPALSQQLYQRLRRPKAYLDVVDAGHDGLVLADDARARAVRAAFVDFLNLELRRQADAGAALQRDGDRPRVTHLYFSP